MKTLTELQPIALKNIAVKLAELEGKTPEEVAAAMVESFKLEGDKLRFSQNALELLKGKFDGLKRIVVLTLVEGEKPPLGSRKAKDEESEYYIIEYFPQKQSQQPPRDDRDDRGGRGGKRGGGRDGKRDGGRDGNRGGKPSGDRPSFGDRPPRTDGPAIITDGGGRAPRAPRGPAGDPNVIIVAGVTVTKISAPRPSASAKADGTPGDVATKRRRRGRRGGRGREGAAATETAESKEGAVEGAVAVEGAAPSTGETSAPRAPRAKKERAPRDETPGVGTGPGARAPKEGIVPPVRPKGSAEAKPAEAAAPAAPTAESVQG